MDVPPPRIDHRADVAVRAGHSLQVVAIEDPHRHAAADALFCRRLDGAGMALVIGGPEGAVLPRIAGGVEAADELQREARRVVGKRAHAGAEIRAESGLDRVRVELEAGIALPAIVAGGAPT